MSRYSPVLIIIFLCLGCSEKSASKRDFYLNLDDHRIHVKSSGNGPVIILAHGGYLDLEMWHHQVESFEDSFTLIRFSDLGHGKTDQGLSPSYGYNLIHALTKEFSRERFILIGLSWGAMLCVDFALQYPEEVDKLILVSPGLSGWEYFRDSLAGENFSDRQTAIARNDTLEAARLFHQNWVVGPRRSRDDLDSLFFKKSFDMVYRNMRNHWQSDWSSLDTVPARRLLENIKAPTYLIIGSEDAQDIRLIAEEYDSRIANSKLIQIEGAAHLLNMETPGRFNAILHEILLGPE